MADPNVELDITLTDNASASLETLAAAADGTDMPIWHQLTREWTQFWADLRAKEGIEHGDTGGEPVEHVAQRTHDHGSNVPGGSAGSSTSDG